MKIQFEKPYPDPYNAARVYLRGWVAEFTDPDAQRAIADGYAKPAPPDAFSRKYTAPDLVSSDCVAPTSPPAVEKAFAPKEWEVTTTGEEIALDELTEQKPQSVPKTARFKL